MTKMKTRTLIASAIVFTTGAATAQTIELAVNGGFETGDFTGWDFIPTGSSSFNLTNDANTGMFAAELFNNDMASGALARQANIGQGIITAGMEVTISFAAKGEGAAGGVAFAEFFSELDGGGTSASEILGGGPLMLTNEYQTFEFTTFAGPDVSGGVTLQFGAITGAVDGSVSLIFIDDVSVTIVPAPGAAAVLGLGGLVAIRRRR